VIFYANFVVIALKVEIISSSNVVLVLVSGKLVFNVVLFFLSLTGKLCWLKLVASGVPRACWLSYAD